MDKEKILNLLKRYWLITIAIILSILALKYGFTHIKKSEGHISETYVSLAAFIMLIATSIMQNKDLNMQRKEMRETREEFERQTKEQEKLNMLNKENSNLNSFFELIRLKDEKHKELIYVFDGDEENNLTRFLNFYVTNIYTILKNKKEYYNYNEAKQIEFLKKYTAERLSGLEYSKSEEHIKELYNILKTIQLLVIGNKEDDSIFRKDWIDDENNLGMIFHSLLTKSERALVLFLDNQLLPDDFIDDMRF